MVVQAVIDHAVDTHVDLLRLARVIDELDSTADHVELDWETFSESTESGTAFVRRPVKFVEY